MNNTIVSGILGALLLIAVAQSLYIGRQTRHLPTRFVQDLPARDSDALVHEEYKRAYSSAACRQCMLNENWRSCAVCNSRPGGSVPYYEGVSKRAFPVINMAAVDANLEGQVADQYLKEKRSVIDYCRCCVSSSSSSDFCCERCNMTPYY